MDWITDRPPTEADGDEDGDVLFLCDGGKAWYTTHWENVFPGQPWIPFAPPAAAPEPANPTSQLHPPFTHPAAAPGFTAAIIQPRRIVSIALDADSVAAVADDGSAWWLSADGTKWTQMPALPDRE